MPHSLLALTLSVQGRNKIRKMITGQVFLMLQGLYLVTACGRCCNHYYYGNLEDRTAVVESRIIRQTDKGPAPEAQCGRGVYLTALQPNHWNRTKEKLARMVYGSNWMYALDNNKLDYSIGFNLKYSQVLDRCTCNKSGIHLLVYRKDINIDDLDTYTVAKNDATACRSGKRVIVAGLLFCATIIL